MLVTNICSFSQNVSCELPLTTLIMWARFNVSPAKALNSDKSFGKELTLSESDIILFVFNSFPNKPWILLVSHTSLLKTLWKKEKLLITSNFSFSTLFSTCLEKFLPSSSNLKLSSENSFNLEESKICCLRKG